MSFYDDASYEFTWDEKKAKINLAKHRISFDEAKTIFKDPFLVTYPDETHSENENRFISIGTSANQRLLIVVHLSPLQEVDL
ncbi:MAG: BrnT family toxin [Chloroflexota bacterium]